MSYTPTTWAAGDTVTAAKLNKLEQGVAAGGGVLVVHDVDGALDKTWKEIHDAGFCVLVIEGTGETQFTPISSIGINTAQDEWYVLFDYKGYSARSETGYPKFVIS